MLGKQRKNQATDPQFMDAAWKNMAEILDQEMPVEKKERRIGWLSIAAVLIVGFVGGITVMWGLQRHQSTPVASNHSVDTHHQTEMIDTDTERAIFEISSNSQKEETPISITNNKTAHTTKTTPQQNTITSNSDNKTSSSIAVNTSKKEVVPNNNIPSTLYFDQDELSQESGTQNSAISLAKMENMPEKEMTTAGVISTNPIEKIENLSTPLAELSNLDMAMLPIESTNFTMDDDLDFPENKKWKSGIYAGAVVAGKRGNGLETAFRVERKLGNKWTIETGLGLRATQLAFLSENDDTDNLTFSGAFNEPIPVPSEIERLQMANKINVDAPDYHLTVPLSVVFRPKGKLRLALGMNWAYRLNKLKDASSFDINGVDMSSGNNIAEDADRLLNNNSLSERFNDFRLNLGVGYQFNTSTGIELAYSERLTNRGSFSDEGGSPANFFQLGLIHYFGG